MAAADRAKEYVKNGTVLVDITLCTPGSNARAVKPGGVASLMESIKESGYQRVLPT
jgi:hypothetical protein